MEFGTPRITPGQLSFSITRAVAVITLAVFLGLLRAPGAQALDLTGTWSSTNHTSFEAIKCTFYQSGQKQRATLYLGPIEISESGTSIYADTAQGQFQGGTLEPFPSNDKSVAAMSACSVSQGTIGALFVRKAMDGAPAKMVVELIGYRPVYHEVLKCKGTFVRASSSDPLVSPCP